MWEHGAPNTFIISVSPNKRELVLVATKDIELRKLELATDSSLRRYCFKGEQTMRVLVHCTENCLNKDGIEEPL